MVDQNVLDAFQMMWGQFPEPVMLLHKSRTILAVNDVARTAGVPLGVKCSSLNPANEGDHHCRQCKASQALRARTPVVETSQIGERHVKGYWIPLRDFEDVYVHFGVTITEDIKAALSEAKTA
ncbi:hypothetical protein [Fundidesulfovibrio putealis]|uniref:hypothetical protein n=1 Tax=Fundidesulfovibrio putealis TaxID=270496 RepID=UPI0003FC4570|nr:hypothetical protein [Fundidesulfovibrio putealis]